MKFATALPAFAVVVALTFTGCVRREGRNSDCIWPPEQNERTLDPNHGADASHLREDVEFAEDLAIRYMDAQRHPRSTPPQPRRPPGEVMNTCRNSLLQQISTSHNVPPNEVVRFFGRRSLAIDLAIILPFLALYALLAVLIAGWLRRRYPPEESMTAALAMALLSSLAFGVGGVLLGEEWSTMAESIRIGTGHLSYRVDRLPWASHRFGFFVLCVTLFWLAAAVRFRVQSRIVRSPTSHRII
jgi:hypothetical protein